MAHTSHFVTVKVSDEFAIEAVRVRAAILDLKAEYHFMLDGGDPAGVRRMEDALGVSFE